jgi:hypothetical protein
MALRYHSVGVFSKNCQTIMKTESNKILSDQQGNPN